MWVIKFTSNKLKKKFKHPPTHQSNLSELNYFRASCILDCWALFRSEEQRAKFTASSILDTGFFFCSPYLVGSSGLHPQPSRHPHSGLHQRANIVHRSLPRLLNFQPDLWHHSETWRGRFGDCWCQRRRASQTQGLQPSSTCVQGCCFSRRSTKRNEGGARLMPPGSERWKNPSWLLPFLGSSHFSELERIII